MDLPSDLPLKVRRISPVESRSTKARIVVRSARAMNRSAFVFVFNGFDLDPTARELPLPLNAPLEIPLPGRVRG